MPQTSVAGRLAVEHAVGGGQGVDGGRQGFLVGRGEADLRLVLRRRQLDHQRRADQPRGVGRLAGEIGLQLLHRHGETGVVAGPVVPLRGGRGEEGHDLPLAETPLDRQRGAVAEVGDHLHSSSRAPASSPWARRCSARRSPWQGNCSACRPGRGRSECASTSRSGVFCKRSTSSDASPLTGSGKSPSPSR